MLSENSYEDTYKTLIDFYLVSPNIDVLSVKTKDLSLRLQISTSTSAFCGLVRDDQETMSAEFVIFQCSAIAMLTT